MKQRIQQSFNSSAQTYDSAACLQRDVARRVIEKLNSPSAKNILEIGCGTGLLSKELIYHFPTSHILFTDIAPAMLIKCRQKLTHYLLQNKSRYKLSGDLEFICCDAENLLLDKKFDLIISSMVMHWFTDIGMAIKKLCQLLTPNGKLIFAIPGESSLMEIKQIFYRENTRIPILTFPSMSSLSECFPKLDFSSEIIKKNHTNLLDFFHSLKKLGATTTQHPVLSTGQLRRLLRKYNQNIDLSYEIIYGEWVNA